MAWQQSGDLYGQVVNSAGAAQGGDRPLVTHEGNQQEAALATGHSAGYGLLAWRDNRSGNDDIYSRLITPPLQTTRISYSYDPLYRLRTAIYTGAITATYHYVYDGVGNMTAYTEQVNGQTTAVSRSFNAANQLVSSNDGSETVDYAYDANGNLVTIDHWLMSVQTTYAYDQRNLLTSQTNWRIGEPDLQAAFVYDGDGYRVQMIDYTGLPLATTYSNDILGLTQVLLADDGATTTANLLGLDLIAQDNGSETRVLLADGLGSARVEMVGGVVETTTTYEPYGKLLAQTGSSGTTYGFTGEQEDAATGLVYLRARYYSPELHGFQMKDPFSGYGTLPVSQNGYNYANGNPINHTDPSGLCAEIGDEACWSLAEQLWRTGQGSLNELGSMDYRDLELLRIYATCASNSVFDGTHPVVKARACAMINQLASENYLVSSNPSIVVSQGYRTPADAHRFSTSYHLFYGFIDSEVLGCYPIDSDGNIWNDPATDFLYTFACSGSSTLSMPANLCSPRARWSIENAKKGEGSNYFCGAFKCGFSYAQEGYPPGDPRRLPNSDDVPVSNHVYGLAVDIVGWWSDDPDDIWGLPITNIAQQFRLDRPFTEAYVNEQNAQLARDNGRTRLQAEFWHFEPIDIERYR